jgi:hypothetical protein
MRLKWKLDSACFELVLILTQDRCIVYAERTISSEVVLDHRVTWVMWNLVSVCLETVLVSVQDRCRFAPIIP